MVRRLLVFAAGTGIWLLLSLSGLAAAAGEKKQKTTSYALIAGTVFRDTGFTLRGAEVTLTPSPEGKLAFKVKPMKTASDARGEYTFRVPAGAMRYTVSVKASGFRSQQKQADVGGDERVDVFFHLDPEAKQ